MISTELRCVQSMTRVFETNLDDDYVPMAARSGARRRSVCCVERQFGSDFLSGPSGAPATGGHSHAPLRSRAGLDRRIVPAEARTTRSDRRADPWWVLAG